MSVEEWTTDTIDFHNRLGQWITIPGTGIQIMAKPGEPLGKFHIRRRKSRRRR